MKTITVVLIWVAALAGLVVCAYGVHLLWHGSIVGLFTIWGGVAALGVDWIGYFYYQANYPT